MTVQDFINNFNNNQYLIAYNDGILTAKKGYYNLLKLQLKELGKEIRNLQKDIKNFERDEILNDSKRINRKITKIQ